MTLFFSPFIKTKMMFLKSHMYNTEKIDNLLNNFSVPKFFFYLKKRINDDKNV